MKKIFQAKFFKPLTLLLALVPCVFSCGDEEEIRTELISIFASNDYFNGYEIFAVASDANGDVIDFAQLKGEETITLTSTSFNKNSFTLSIVQRILNADNGDKYLSGYSWYEIKPGGSLTLTGRETHLANISLSNSNIDAGYYGLSSNRSFYLVDPRQTFVAVLLSGQSSRIFSTMYDKSLPVGSPTHYSFPTTEFSDLEIQSLDLATVNIPLDTETVDVELTEEAIVSLYGILGTGEDRQIFQNIVSNYTNSGSLDLKYPGSVFDSYASSSILISDNYTAFIFDKDSKFNFTVPSYTYSAEGQGQSFTYSVNGGDFVTVEGTYNNPANRNYFSFRAYIPPRNNQTIAMVKLPEEIIEIFDEYDHANWEFNHQSPLIVDYEDFSTVEEFFYSSFDRDYKFYDHNVTSLRLNFDGGRIGGRSRKNEEDWKFPFLPTRPLTISKNGLRLPR